MSIHFYAQGPAERCGAVQAQWVEALKEAAVTQDSWLRPTDDSGDADVLFGLGICEHRGEGVRSSLKGTVSIGRETRDFTYRYAPRQFDNTPDRVIRQPAGRAVRMIERYVRQLLLVPRSI